MLTRLDKLIVYNTFAEKCDCDTCPFESPTNCQAYSEENGVCYMVALTKKLGKEFVLGETK